MGSSLQSKGVANRQRKTPKEDDRLQLSKEPNHSPNTRVCVFYVGIIESLLRSEHLPTSDIHRHQHNPSERIYPVESLNYSMILDALFVRRTFLMPILYLRQEWLKGLQMLQEWMKP